MRTELSIDIASIPLANDLANTLIGAGYDVEVVAPLVGSAGLTIRKPRLRRRRDFILEILGVVRSWMLYRDPIEAVGMRAGNASYHFTTAEDVELAIDSAA